MNIIAKRPRMQTQEAVQAIATFFAALERQQRKAIREARKLRDEYQAIHDNGSAGALATMAAFADLDAMVTSQYAETLKFHRLQTMEAQNLGIDAGPMASDPEEDGGIVVMSGGDR